jgi:hypothetical protein
MIILKATIAKGFYDPERARETIFVNKYLIKPTIFFYIS